MELTPELSAGAVLLVGFVLGLAHAVEADHLAAVTAVVSEKQSLLTASLVGGLWGIGHTLSLVTVGVAVIFMKLQISESTEARLEAVVGVMLILLGINALRKVVGAEQFHVHTHDHGGLEHAHFHAHEAEQTTHSHHLVGVRSVLIGMVHGLAGSAALMLLILPTIRSSGLALVYIVIFGAGSIGGMIAMSFLIGLPFHLTAGRFEIMHKGIRFLAGCFSFGLGLVIVYETLAA